MPDITVDPDPAPRDDGAQQPLPWWWFGLFVITFLLFTALMLTLVALGQSVEVAVGVPATLSTAALLVLQRLSVLARRRER